MEANADIVKKTPGDLKREEIARELGEGWVFFRNDPVIEREPDNYRTEGAVGVTIDLEKRKKAGQIEDWRAGRPAFRDDGQRFLESQVQAAYFKPKAQIK